MPYFSDWSQRKFRSPFFFRLTLHHLTGPVSRAYLEGMSPKSSVSHILELLLNGLTSNPRFKNKVHSSLAMSSFCSHLPYMSLCQKVLGEDHPFFGPKCFFRFKFSLNKPNFIWKSMHQRDNKDKLDSQSQFWVSKIWKFTPSPGRKSAKEGWTFRVHCFSCRFVCIFLL